MSDSKTSFISAQDGIRIASDVTGSGPAIFLLHGGSRSREDWHTLGYVERLKNDFTVVTMDARGHGESDKPTSSDAYGIKTMCQDILDVADACAVEQFAIWGFSYGGNIGRFLATSSERVSKIIIIGIPFGPAASDAFQQFIADYRTKWRAILQRQREGTLDVATLSEQERSHLEHVGVPVRMAWMGAMPEWGGVEPEDLACPALWLVGSENKGAMKSVEVYKGRLANSVVQASIIPGLDHRGEIEEIDTVLPIMLDFTR